MMRSPTAVVIAAWLVLGAIVVAIEAPPDGEPGLNYDEAFLGQQARDFLEPERLTTHPPSERSTYILGRRFPLRNAAYLGGLKSQLLIPAFALFGSDPHTLRLATLGTALLSLLLATLWARRVFGLEVALLGAVFVAFDPSFVFFGAREWGPYTTLLLCRCAGLWALTLGWQTRRTGVLAFGALVLGLGVYARADFVIIGVAAAVGLLAARGSRLWSEIRERPGATAAALVAVVVGSSPMLLSAIDLLTVESGIADRGDLAYRAQVLWSTLDGSYYHRVIATGGLFEELFDTGAPTSFFGLALVASIPVVAARVLLRRSGEDDARDGLVFLLVTVAFLGAAMLALPGAVRAHHMLNLMPFTHLLIASALVQLWRTRATRIVAATIALAVVAGSAHVTWQTRALIAETGGRGRYSHALDDFAAELEADPLSVAVSLDWGFHETMQFLTSTTPLVEPIWKIPGLLANGRPWVYAGGANHYYLVFDPRYDLFQLGPKLLETARALSEADVEIRAHRDREGEVAFYSVRFLGPHRLVFTGDFQVSFLPR
jgi:hypothetical protein